MSVEQSVQCLIELDGLKTILRKTKIIGGSRFENSAEHSWQVALMAMAFAEYAAEPVAIDRVVKMLLLHDVGEIDAGDVIVYAKIDPVQRSAAELAGVERVFGVLPPEQAEPLIELWKEFEAAQTPEARFAHAMDRAAPVLLHLRNGGRGWRENGIRYEQVVTRIRGEIEAGSPALWRYLAVQLEAARQQGWFLS